MCSDFWGIIFITLLSRECESLRMSIQPHDLATSDDKTRRQERSLQRDILGQLLSEFIEDIGPARLWKDI